MKNTILFIILTCCIATHGAEDDREKSTDGKLQSRGKGIITPLKGIRRDPPDEKKAPGTKRPKKAVEFDFEPPSLPVSSLPDSQIGAPQIILKRISTSKDYVRIIRTIYTDAEHTGIRKIAGMTREEALAAINKMKQTREYAQPVDFGNYMICDTSGTAVIGRFMFTNFIYEGAPNEGLLQTHVHLISESRGRGLGNEALQCLIKDVIGSKIGKKCSFMKSMLTQGSQEEEEKEEGFFESTLRGIYGKSNLLWTHILDNYTTISAYYNAGFGVKIWNGDVIMSYPPECYPPGASLVRSEVGTVLLIAKLMQDCRELKGKKHTPAPLKSNATPPEEAVIDLGEILKNPKVYEKQIASLKKQYRKLLAVTEPFTFLSALNILSSIFGMTKEDLDPDVSSAKALSMRALLEKEAKIPNGLDFLKRFTPPSEDPPKGSPPKPQAFRLFLEEDSV